MNKVESFKERLNKALVIKGIKPVELCKLTGISKGLLSQYMNGYCEAKQDNFYLIANALNVDYAWLMGLDVPMDRESEYHLKLREEIKELLIIANDSDLEKILQYIGDIGVSKKGDGK